MGHEATGPEIEFWATLTPSGQFDPELPDWPWEPPGHLRSRLGGPVDAAVSRQFKLLVSERPQDVETVREAIDGLVAALAVRAS